MISKKDFATICYRQWRGENIKIIAEDYEMKPEELRNMRQDLADEVKRLESEFEAQHTVRKIRHGFVLIAYNVCRTRNTLEKGLIEVSEKSNEVTAQITTPEEAKRAIADFEQDFGITLV